MENLLSYEEFLDEKHQITTDMIGKNSKSNKEKNYHPKKNKYLNNLGQYLDSPLIPNRGPLSAHINKNKSLQKYN